MTSGVYVTRARTATAGARSGWRCAASRRGWRVERRVHGAAATRATLSLSSETVAFGGGPV